MLSFVIPCYNTEKYIDACLASVCGQSLRDTEIICIDDGSTDTTPEILIKWRKRDARVRVVAQENRGVSAARNRGLSMARGEYVYFLDSDDEVADPAVMEECCRRMNESRADVGVGGAVTIFESDALAEQFPEFIQRYQIRHAYEPVMGGIQAIRALRRNKEWTVPPATKLFRRSFLKRNRLIFQEGYIHEDSLFAFEAVYLAARVQVFSEAFYRRRIREGSIMTGQVTHFNTLGHLQNLIEGLRFVERHKKEHPIEKAAVKSIIVSKKMAVDSFLQLDNHERSLLKTEMSPEQSFYFDAFISREAKLTADLEKTRRQPDSTGEQPAEGRSGDRT